MFLSVFFVAAVVVMGLIWLLDAVWLKSRRETAGSDTKAPWYVDYSRSLFPVLLFVLVVRSFIVEPFQIPSGSMEPTLKVGDYIAVNKFSYGLRLPITHTRILSTGEPHRGDVIVFRFPLNPSVDFIKRVVGVPGDHVVYQDKHLYINGKLISKTLVSDDVASSPGMQLFQEDLDGVKHAVYNNPDVDSKGFDGTVPAGHYFVMGDNRDNSADSRYWGFVPEQNLVGKAFFVWMHWHGGLPSFTHDRIIHG